MILVSALSDITHVPLRDGQKIGVRIGTGRNSTIERLTYDAARRAAGLPAFVGREWPAVRANEQSAAQNPVGNGLAAGDVQTLQYFPTSGFQWGHISPHSCGARFAAGLGFEYRQAAFLHKAATGIKFNVCAYFYAYNHGDTTEAYTTPPSFGWAQTDFISSGVGGTFYQWASEDWRALVPFTSLPSKASIYPALYGKVDAGSTANGQAIDYSLQMRWVG